MEQSCSSYISPNELYRTYFDYFNSYEEASCDRKLTAWDVIEQNDLGYIVYAISRGATADEIFGLDQYPLQSAIHLNAFEFAQALLQAGADTTRMEHYEPLLKSVMSFDMKHNDRSCRWTRLLLQYYRNINSTVDGVPGFYLFYAIQLGSPTMVRLLCEHKVDVNVSGIVSFHGNNRPTTPLKYACSMNDREIIEILLEYGADGNEHFAMGSVVFDYFTSCSGQLRGGRRNRRYEDMRVFADWCERYGLVAPDLPYITAHFGHLCVDQSVWRWLHYGDAKKICALFASSIKCTEENYQSYNPKYNVLSFLDLPKEERLPLDGEPAIVLPERYVLDKRRYTLFDGIFHWLLCTYFDNVRTHPLVRKEIMVDCLMRQTLALFIIWREQQQQTSLSQRESSFALLPFELMDMLARNLLIEWAAPHI